jgi:hypothetical protein
MERVAEPVLGTVEVKRCKPSVRRSGVASLQVSVPALVRLSGKPGRGVAGDYNVRSVVQVRRSCMSLPRASTWTLGRDDLAAASLSPSSAGDARGAAPARPRMLRLTSISAAGCRRGLRNGGTCVPVRSIKWNQSVQSAHHIIGLSSRSTSKCPPTAQIPLRPNSATRSTSCLTPHFVRRESTDDTVIASSTAATAS